MAKIRRMSLLALTITFLISCTLVSAQSLHVSTLKGKLVDIDNNPVANVSIEVKHELRGATTITSEKDGEFKTRLLETGIYTITPQAEGMLVQSVHLEVKGPTGIIETNQTITVDQKQEMPPVDVRSDRTYSMKITMVKKGYFEARQMQIEVAQLKGALLDAENLIKEKKYPEAIEKLEKVIKKNPDETYPHYLLGVAYFETGKPDLALKEFQQIITLKSDFQGAYYYIGRIYYDQNDPEKAIEAFEKEKLVAPEMPEIYQNLGVLYQNAKKYPEAIKQFEKLKELRPDDKEVLEKLRYLYEQVGEKEKQEQVMTSLETTGSVDPVSCYNMGTQHWKAKEYDKAESYFTKALAADPNLADAHKALAYCFIREKKNTEALTHLKRYIELKPDAPDKDKIKKLISDIQGN